MFASIMNLILILVFIYLILYGVYLLTINLKALFCTKKFYEENSIENEVTIIKKKLCVIIFANSKSKRLEPLLQALSKQTYKKEDYSVHVVFARDSDSLLYTPDCMSGAQIHCIENPEFFKKNKALNVFIEKIITNAKFDGYVFLGASRFIKANYLENVNLALNKFPNGAITGKIAVINDKDKKELIPKIIEAKQEFQNNTQNIARRMFELSSVIDSDNCVLSSDILEKTGRICFETREDELKYSLFLASNNIKPIYSPFIETGIMAENYNPATAGLKVRLILFKYYLKLLYKKPWYFVESVVSLIQPNVAVVCLLYLTLLYCSFKFICSIGVKYIIHLAVFYFAIWFIGLVASRMNLVKIMFFMLYPFYSFGFNFKKITKDISKRALQKSITEERNIKSATMDAVVTDGTKDIVCKMDLISEEGMRRVILRFRKKRVISDESIRMHDAVENISKRVKSHGFTLKICQNCRYFKSTPDETVDLLKGVCAANSVFTEENKAFETLIWNTCNRFIPTGNENIIDNINKDKK